MAGKRVKTASANVSVVAAHVDCPHCDAAIYESATPHENIAWGSVIACWSCGGPVRLGASPFLRRLR